MQRIEPDAVGAELACEFDQALQVSEIAHAPIACRAHAVELHRDQPCAIKIAGERFRRHDQWRVLALSAAIGEPQAITA